MKREKPIWEADMQMIPFRNPAGDTTTHYLTRRWPDGGTEVAIMVEKLRGQGGTARWVRVSSKGREYYRLLKR